MSFQNLKIIDPILKALKNEGYIQPTPVQEQCIPHLLQGKDLLGCAQTGTGKTAAFAIPVLQILHQQKLTSNNPGIKALILTPTRELAIQVQESFSIYGKYTGLKHLVIFGGVPQQPQITALKQGVDILVATPGRLLDLADQKFINLNHIRLLVLDEADHMLDMGFIHDVKKIIARIPKQNRQTLLFSATMPPAISRLANSLLTDPVQVTITPVSSSAVTVQQTVYFVEKRNKSSLLKHLLANNNIPMALVFTRTKHGADRVAKDLNLAGIRAEAIHGNKSQAARQKALHQFRSKQIRVLVATDIAARGIDIDSLPYVINYELPNVPETYVHRIGRTGRAGASGLALSFCDQEEKPYLHDIQKLIANAIPVTAEHPFEDTDRSMIKHSSIHNSQNASSVGRFSRRRGKQQQPQTAQKRVRHDKAI